MNSDTRKVIVEIGSSGSGTGDSHKKSDDTAANESHTNRKAKTLLGKAVLAERAFYKTLSYSKSLARATIGMVNTLSEDYIGENLYNNISKTIDTGLSAVYMVTSGSTIGAMAAGTALGGAILGAGAFAFGETVQQIERYSQYYRNLNASNFSTSYNRVRAGLSDNNRGTEN